MKALIRKNKFGYQYRFEGDSGFKYFADNVTTKEEMQQYFVNGKHATSGGTFNAPDIVFVNEQNTPAKTYQVIPDKRILGMRYATLDHTDKMLCFEYNDVIPPETSIHFFQGHTTSIQDAEADKMESDQAKIKYYLSVVADSTKEAYQQIYDEHLTESVIKELCDKNAKTFELPAEVEYL